MSEAVPELQPRSADISLRINRGTYIAPFMSRKVGVELYSMVA